MINQTKTDQETRESILQLLSDDEVASVSRIEGTLSLLDGEQYLDLQHLDRGVCAALDPNVVPMGHVLARRAVRPATWAKILGDLQQLAAARNGTGR